MKRIIISIVFASFSQLLFSQNSVETILNEIENNNIALKAKQSKIESEKLQVKSSNNLENPEFSINVLQGSPSQTGSRVDMSVTQSFDFPTMYSQRNKQNKLSIDQLELELKQYKLELKKRVYSLCVDIYFNTQLLDKYDERIEIADSVLQAFEIMFSNREITVLEYNKAFLYKTDLNTEKERVLTEISNSSIVLNSLNNGNEIDISNVQLFEIPVLTTFEDWLITYESQITYLKLLEKESEKAEYSVKLSKAERLPSFNIGYMMEQGDEESFRGLTAGMSIPLWENRYKVASAQLNREYVSSYRQSESLYYKESLRAQYNTCKSLLNTYESYANHVKKYNTNALLQASFDNGQVSFTDYLIQLDNTYEYYEQEIQIHKAAYVSFIELFIYM